MKVELYSVGEIFVNIVFKKTCEGKVSAEAHFGGTSANLAIAVSRLGHRAGFIGAIGNDLLGEFLLRTLRINNVDTRLVRIKKARTTLAFVVIDEKGGEKFFFYRKPWGETADTMLKIKDVDFGKIGEARIVHFSGFSTSHPPTSETVYAIAEYALERKIKVSYDPTFRENIWLSKNAAKEAFERSLKLSSIVSLSVDEMEEFYGTTDYRLVADKILGKHSNVETVAIRLGAKGAYAKSRNHSEAFKEAFKVKVVDTTGVDDAWTAAFLVSHILEDMDLEYSLLFANATAAIVCSKFGAITAFPKRDEVEDFLRKTI